MPLFQICTILTGLLFLFLARRTQIFNKTLISLQDQFIEPARSWPKVSLVIPACNEAGTVEVAGRSLLQMDYPNLEVVFVNDRSVDETGALIDLMASADDRFKAIHIETLPEGWLGKVHAVSQGISHVSGEWILVTDADVHFSDQALKKAICYSEKEGLDFLTVVPDLLTRTFGLHVMMAHLYHIGSLLFDLRKLNDPSYKACYGQGAFLLFKQSIYRVSEGLEWLKMEALDDVGLALLLRRAGARMGAVSGRNEIRLEWYTSLRSMIGGLEKNGFAFYQYSLLVLFAVSILNWLIFFGFTLFPILTKSWLYGGFVAGCLAIYLVSINRQLKQLMDMSSFCVLFFPLAFVLMPLVFIRAAALALVKQGVQWRTTFYSLEELKANQRMKLGNLVFSKAPIKEPAEASFEA